MKKRPVTGSVNDPAGLSEGADPAAFAQAALAGERSRPIELDDGIRQKMESHFGLDFGKVRLAQSDLPGKMGVDAIAQGDLIRFAPGAYRPGSSEGEKLLGHELGHLVRQSRMGPGLAGLPIDDPASESGADSLAAGAFSGAAGAVRAFTPAPAASAPMEGGRLWSRIKQETHRWFLGGKLGSWWRRRQNKEAARAAVDAETQGPLKPYSDVYKDMRHETLNAPLINSFQERGMSETNAPGFWDQNQNPILQHPDFYPQFLFPPRLLAELSKIPGNKLTQVERHMLQSSAGNPGLLDPYIGRNTHGREAALIPNLAKAINTYNSKVLQPERYRAGMERMRNPKTTAPKGDKPENHKIWKATAAQLGGSRTNPFDDGYLAVKQEAIENANSVDEVQKVLDKYVFGHKTQGAIGGTHQQDMDLRMVKDMAKNLAHVAEDFPDIKELIRAHDGTEAHPEAQMFVNPSGDMGWSGIDPTLRGTFKGAWADFVGSNRSHPFSAASTRYAAVHESGHLVDNALTRKIMRGRTEPEIQKGIERGHGSDILIRYTLNKLLKKGNKDAKAILDELHAANSDIKSFKDLDLTRSGTDRNGKPKISDDAKRLGKALESRGFTSGYGATQPVETFAESFSKVYEQGEDADEFTKTLVKTSQKMLQNPKKLDRVFRKYNKSALAKQAPDAPELIHQPIPYQPRTPPPRPPVEEPQWYQMRAVTPQPGAEGGQAGGPSMVAVPVPEPDPLPLEPSPTRVGGRPTQFRSPQRAKPPATGDGGSAPSLASILDEESSSSSDEDSSSYSDDSSSSWGDSSSSDDSSSSWEDSSTSSEEPSTSSDDDDEFWENFGSI